jgi:hypothetical protein
MISASFQASFDLSEGGLNIAQRVVKGHRSHQRSQ